MEMDEIRKIAWKNLNENSKEIKRQTIVTPKKTGEIFPLATLGGGKDFLGVYIGEHNIYKNKDKNQIYVVPNDEGKYVLFSASHNGTMLWHSEGDDGPCWPAGISVVQEAIANNENQKGIESRFGEIFKKYPQIKLEENLY